MIDQAEKWAESALQRLRISCSVCGEIDVPKELAQHRKILVSVIQGGVGGVDISSVPMTALLGGLVSAIAVACLLQDHELRLYLAE